MSEPRANILRHVISAIPAVFGCAAVYGFKRIWEDGFVKKRQRSWPIQRIYSATADPLVYYGVLLLCLAWAAFCFWLTYRILSSSTKPIVPRE